MKIYQAKKGLLIQSIVLLLAGLPFFIYLTESKTIETIPIILLPLISPLVFILWFYLGTSYKLESGQLSYKSGFIKGKIPVSTIREIHKDTTLWAGLKPALASRGIIINYGKFDEIYIAPENTEELIEDLVSINPSIKILE
ncbi:MAG: PH domain-containing protein, partial [Algoriphagus sp.]|nr:PH domain-containing protein [Algoriphagus sp.]